MIQTFVGALAVLAGLGAPALIFPSQAPRLPPIVGAAAAEGFTACAAWSAKDRRPVPSPESVSLRGATGVVRSGRRLLVGAQRFVDVRGEQEMDKVDYRYVGRLPGLSAHVVYKRPYEGDAWLLVAPGLSEPIALPGLPVASPRGHALAAAAADPTFRQAGVTIVEHRMRGFAVAARFDDAAYPCDLHWLGEDVLSLKVSVDGPGHAPVRWAPATIVREAGQWTYHPPAKEP